MGRLRAMNGVLALAPLLFGLLAVNAREALQKNQVQDQKASRSERSLIADEMGLWEIKEAANGVEDEWFLKSLCNSTLAKNSSKLAVVAGTKYSPEWLTEQGLDYLVYQSESQTQPNYYFNHANEAGAYLQFIVDYYDCLPEYVVFLHGHIDSWHSKKMDDTLKSLQWEKVPGYADLNRFEPRQMPMAARPRYPPQEPIAVGDEAYRGGFASHQIIDGKAYPWWESHLHLLQNSYARAYDQFWGFWFGAMPDMIQHVAGAQHVVTRDALLGRPRIFFVEALRYLLPHNNDLRANHVHERSYVVGDMFSLMWHMIHGQPAIYEPLPECELFTNC